MRTPSGLLIAANTVFSSEPGNEFAWYESVFGAVQRDAHVKAWKHHQFRLSAGGRDMMRRRLAAMYPGVPLELAHDLYSVGTPDYHFDRRYV